MATLLKDRKTLREVHRETHEAISELSAQEAALREQIRELEKFIIQTPKRLKRAQEEMEERACTIPAPDDWTESEADEDDDGWGGGAYIQYVSDLEAPQRLMRRHAAELKRRRRRHFITFVIVACLVGSFGFWLWNFLT